MNHEDFPTREQLEAIQTYVDHYPQRAAHVTRILVDMIRGFGPGREFSLAITKLEEAEMWLDRTQR
jgi:hypothetical protein